MNQEVQNHNYPASKQAGLQVLMIFLLISLVFWVSLLLNAPQSGVTQEGKFLVPSALLLPSPYVLSAHTKR